MGKRLRRMKRKDLVEKEVFIIDGQSTNKLSEILIESTK
jgi:hypothetical protein